jgi:pimeloyl-ACP methyl ester carboxylesterase
VAAVAGPPQADTAVVFVHGNPGSKADWAPFLEQVGRFARAIAADMPGYEDADKPESFDYSTDGQARHLGGILEELGVRHAHLVLTDLGGPWGLAWAAAHPEALASLSLINIGVLPGYRWHRFARMYRVRGLGELMLATVNPTGLAYLLRRGNPRGLPRAYIDGMVRQLRDPGTRRAILRYYRATDLAADTERAGRALRDANPPTLVIWGAHDPYVPVRFAEIQRQFFPRAEVVILPESGHWPFVEDVPGVTAALIPFLKAQTG